MNILNTIFFMDIFLSLSGIECER